MSEDAFDAIIVGAGCAGAVAAYTLAKAGKSVLVVERGNFAGAKNMTGGRIYAHSLKKIFPDFEKTAPLERKITHEKISFIAPDSNFTVDFTSAGLGQEGKDAYSVLHAQFNPWLAEQAERAGADFVYGIRVDDLIVRDGAVRGVRAGEDELEAHVTILADGCNSLLAQKIGLAQKPQLVQMAVGVKEVLELPADVIEDRFNCNPGEGASWLFAGDSTHGHVGGGFLYTNKNSISLGLVATLSDLITAQTPVYQMLEDFKGHDAVKPLVKGAKVVEYSGHLVPEGGYRMIPTLAGDGVLVTGDAAMLCINLGYSVRGIDFAIASGEMAGKAAIKALEAGDTSKAGLGEYENLLKNSFVLKDLEQFQKFPHTMESTKHLFKGYPEMVRDMMLALFVVDGKPVEPIRKKLVRPVKELGLMTVAKEMMGMVRSL